MTLLFLTLIATAILAGVLQGAYHIKPVDPMHRDSILSIYEDIKIDVESLPTMLRCYYEELVAFNFGIRGWKWQKYEHAIWGAVIIGSMVIGHYLISHFVLNYQYLVTLCLVAVISNDLFEYAYSYARFKTFINPHPESFNIADIIKFHAKSTTMHIVRLALIIACIIILIVL